MNFSPSLLQNGYFRCVQTLHFFPFPSYKEKSSFEYNSCSHNASLFCKFWVFHVGQSIPCYRVIVGYITCSARCIKPWVNIIFLSSYLLFLLLCFVNCSSFNGCECSLGDACFLVFKFMLLGICSKMQKQGERPWQAVKLTLCRPDFDFRNFYFRNGRTWAGFFLVFELYRNV